MLPTYTQEGFSLLEVPIALQPDTATMCCQHIHPGTNLGVPDLRLKGVLAGGSTGRWADACLHGGHLDGKHMRITPTPLGVLQTYTPTPGNLTPGPPILHIQRCVQVAGWGGDPWSMLPHDHLTSRGTPNRRHTTRSHQHTELGCLAI